MEKLTTRAESAEKEVEELKDALKDAAERIGEADDALENAQDESRTNRVAVEDAKREIAKLEKEIEAVYKERKSDKAAVQEIEKRMSDLQNNVTLAMNGVATAQAERDAAVKATKAIRSALESAESLSTAREVVEKIQV